MNNANFSINSVDNFRGFHFSYIPIHMFLYGGIRIIGSLGEFYKKKTK